MFLFIQIAQCMALGYLLHTIPSSIERAIIDFLKYLSKALP